MLTSINDTPQQTKKINLSRMLLTPVCGAVRHLSGLQLGCLFYLRLCHILVCCASLAVPGCARL